MAKAKLSEILDDRAAERVSVIPDEKNEADIAYDFMLGVTDVPSGVKPSTAAGIASNTGAYGKWSRTLYRQLRLDSLTPYANHPFKPYTEEQLTALAQSIREHGLQQPIIVRETADGRYEILAGHNRVSAFRLNGETQIPAIIVSANDDQAAMIVTETNLRQREKLLPSERAFAYKLQLDATKHQGKKIGGSGANEDISGSETTSAQIAQKLSRDVVAALNGVPQYDVYRHIRLTYLIPELLQLVDDGKLAFVAGVTLSYLTEKQQQTVYQACVAEKAAHIDIKLADYIRKWVDGNKTLETPEDMAKLLQLYAVINRNKRRSITFKRKSFEPYLAKLPNDADLEKLFAEFLRERFGGDSGTAASISRRRRQGSLYSRAR